MKFQSKTNKSFLKSVGIFFVALTVSAVVFIAVAIAVLLSGKSAEKTEDFAAEQVAVQLNRKTVIAVIKNKEKIYINKLFFNFSENSVECAFIKNKTVFCLGKSKTLQKHYSEGGKSQLILALKEYLNEDFKYLEMDEDQLEKLTDIYGGVVVNNNTSRLMGLQVSNFIKNDETANTVVKGLTASYLNNTNGKGIRNNFLSLLENCETDLSYIDFYNNWDEIKAMEGG